MSNTANDQDRLHEIAITDECTTCELCGRENLKRTVLLSDGRYLGTDCAAAVLYGSKRYSSRVIKAVATRKSCEQALKYAVSNLSSIDAMISAGHVRYVIGGKEIGAELSKLRLNAVWDLNRANLALEVL